MAKRNQNVQLIDDFGEFIPGSAKHRGAMTLEEFNKMTEAEQRLKAKRDVVWPVIDAEEAINNGADKFVTFMQTKIRRMTMAVPRSHNNDFVERSKEYVKALAEFRDVVMNLKTFDDLDEFLEDVKNHGEWSNCVSIYKVYSIRWNMSKWVAKFNASNFPTKRKHSKRKKAFKLPPLAGIEREGEDYRKGKDSNEDRWMKKFAFRGVVFGASVPQKERQDDLNCGEDGFTDLAVALDMSNQDVSMNGRLSVSFAARGRGHSGGHYEIVERIMNLTRSSGAGTVAKLWFYAFDHLLAEYCGITSGHFASEATEEEKALLPASFNLLISSLKYDIDGEETNFYKGSKNFDQHFRRGAYGAWGSNAEMASRAFACYVKDCLGCKSDYLIAHADAYEFEYENKCLCAIPQGEERELFNEYFDKVFADIKKMGFFHDRPFDEGEEDDSITRSEGSAEYSINSDDVKDIAI